ncbi:hypothetical protein TURU_132823 [Turdus rufiventris]|nr:hypothetical protein TURU_132823 [Turdus rufiventris]
MWSGLLPPGLNESDVDLSSDDGDETADSCSKEDTEGLQGTGQESNASSEPTVPVTDEEAKQRKTDEVAKSSQQLENEDKWKELTQYFGINDRFESPAYSRAPQKSGLELNIEKCVAEGDIAKAEELSDRLAIRELGVKIAKAAACRNFVKAKQEAEAAQEAQKKKKLAWGSPGWHSAGLWSPEPVDGFVQTQLPCYGEFTDRSKATTKDLGMRHELGGLTGSTWSFVGSVQKESIFLKNGDETSWAPLMALLPPAAPTKGPPGQSCPVCGHHRLKPLPKCRTDKTPRSTFGKQSAEEF